MPFFFNIKKWLFGSAKVCSLFKASLLFTSYKQQFFYCQRMASCPKQKNMSLSIENTPIDNYWWKTYHCQLSDLLMTFWSCIQCLTFNLVKGCFRSSGIDHFQFYRVFLMAMSEDRMLASDNANWETLLFVINLFEW